MSRICPQKVSLIAAMASNRVIGAGNDLPWKIPEDMKYFRDKTRGGILIMGRKSLDSMGGKPLPQRTNLVVSRNSSFMAPEGVLVFDSVEKALDQAGKLAEEKGHKEIFVIGGGEIYRLALKYADRIYLTEIHQTFVGDVTFPEFSKSEFIEVSRVKRIEPIPFDFVVYDRH